MGRNGRSVKPLTLPEHDLLMTLATACGGCGGAVGVTAPRWAARRSPDVWQLLTAPLG
jgi:hypothetical protein